MPLPWSSGACIKSASPMAAAFVTTIAKTSPMNVALKQHQAMMRSSRRLHANASATRNFTSHGRWSHDSAATLTTRQRMALSPKRFQSTSSNNSNPKGNNSRNTLSTISTLSHLLAAGTGTFASTLLALYLATVVETSSHEFLYEYFPHWYYEVAEEDLPNCLKARELARRVNGVVEMNRKRGVVEGGKDSYLMGMDGWMEATTTAPLLSALNEGEQRILDAELLAEADFERQQAQEPATTVTVSAWQRRMTEKRASIIEQEEREFSRGIVVAPATTTTSATGGASLLSHGETAVSSSSKGGGRLELETKKMQDEVTRKLQESLMSVAMTA